MGDGSPLFDSQWFKLMLLLLLQRFLMAIVREHDAERSSNSANSESIFSSNLNPLGYGGGGEKTAAAMAAVNVGKFGSKGGNFNWQFCAIKNFSRLNIGKVGENLCFGVPPPKLPKSSFKTHLIKHFFAAIIGIGCC